MITFYAPGRSGVRLSAKAECAALVRDAVWIDLFQPTREEEETLEAALGTDIPTREEMQAIELSSRLYQENGFLFMTATVLTGAETTEPQSPPFTFIHSNDKLVTIRYANPTSFQAFQTQRDAHLERYQTSDQHLAGLIDAIIERIADILEGAGKDLDAISKRVFQPEGARGGGLLEGDLKRSAGGRAREARRRSFEEVLRLIGGVSDLVSRARESLVTLIRLVAFFREARKESGGARDSLAHWKTVALDLGSLSDHASFLASKVSFLLDATLGMINNEQNAIIKVLSVAALVFLPPTLVAGVYGMNFEFMPELKWAHGYPFALLVMLLSAIVPYLVFRRRGWL